ncbi:trypsin-like serine protease [Sorangium sp. So ce1014]|uniref:trypsin-like serine protease n=1 Tax=Sorangium sp. So ce1014 TaxID=3133326 RepID=UPI003F63C47B
MSARRLRPLSLLALAALSGCAPRDALEGAAERVGERRAAILGGALDAARDYAVGVGDEGGAFCSGVLVARRVVLTAAHCLEPGAGPGGGITRIYFGEDLRPGAAPPPAVVRAVAAVRHPGFDEATFSSDLAILELAAAAPVAPAPLLRETLDGGPRYVGPRLAFVGHGIDEAGTSLARRVAAFPIAAVGPADDVGLDTDSGPIDATQLYARSPGANTCFGDSGGPVLLARGGVERVAGVISYGDAHCEIDGVSARADAPAIEAFIQPEIDRIEAGDPCRGDGICDASCDVGPTLTDPDCAEAHCGEDGICAVACVDPVDPDCAGPDRCGPDGACDPGCPDIDADCVPPPDGEAAAGGPESGAPGQPGGCALRPPGGDGEAARRRRGWLVVAALGAWARRRSGRGRGGARGVGEAGRRSACA